MNQPLTISSFSTEELRAEIEIRERESRLREAAARKTWCATHGHNWQYLGTDPHGSHKGEDFHKCSNCHEYEYR